MAPAPFTPIFPPAEKPLRQRRPDHLINSFSLPTLMTLGAAVQSLLFLVLPARYASLPAALILLRAAVITIRQLTSLDHYITQQRGVIPGRTSAQLPQASYDPLRTNEKSSSIFGSTPAGENVVVFLIGARLNHPLGPFSPAAKGLDEQGMACNQDILDRAKELGCLGMTTCKGNEASSHNMFLSVFYFRDLEGLNRFAHDPIHRRAWEWYEKECTAKGYKHIGVFHEAFCVPKGAYESIYLNMQPTLMGTGNAAIRNEATGTDEWVRTLVDASGRGWRSQHSRLGREVKKQAEEK
ncbi:uncharacterized protein C8A04DRAFT_40625 [Dichotomopilus funicola]|uniref:Monooxygenase n=1 Tax=Dichotomopilus funicola TaxID=1934379 RepID=A0AAN6UUQ9_9PEZI|nr:hypothetical protein C8A04DRAFT_40625 [Dichotomopilus funicola]